MKFSLRPWLRYSLTSIAVLLTVILGFGRAPALAVTPRHYSDLELPAAPEITLPEYSRFELPNGLRVYLLEDHELPLVGGTATIYTGDRLEPADKVGLAGITGAVIRSGGTAAHPPDMLNQLLEQRAASIETGIDTTAGSAGFSALSEDLEEVFGLFAEVLRQPALPQDKIDLVKTQIRGSIARRNDDPDSIAQREFSKLLYGADSPYARTVEYATLDNISRQDVQQFYQQYFHPNKMLLGIIGDFDSAKMRSLIEAKLGDWQPVGADKIDPPQATQAKQGGVFLVDQPQLTQSSVLMGHLGGKLNDPDYAPLTVMNEVLSSFGGRLVNEVRSRQGLAYSVYAFWSPTFDYPGTFTAGGQTRSDATVPFIQSTLEQIEKIRTRPVTEAELSRAKDSVLNAFIFRFSTPFATLSRVMRYDYYGYPQDFIFQYQKQVEATTAADIQRAAQTHLQPDKLVTLVVGNAKDFTPPLRSIAPNGQVTPIDITIPAALGAKS
ncbi:pitrilysin family protein [Leptolyngbya sp. FACHB-711]|uniref:M16 family metallopeptidase n=1 Tax=unclassified Leptolyngbya TaxID=2650499 RepID=UPI0016837807|nr:pitrilysin family protein [Leptolyngbya sp. FACHB-711]MBD1848903.1 insulinase family protein [Cyanobacteria bacterium FACHB-502]MBD2024418.1 insulinase family protein [Leptolyngbya sp. FACHB-711]